MFPSLWVTDSEGLKGSALITWLMMCDVAPEHYYNDYFPHHIP